MNNHASKRIGKIKTNNAGQKMEIIEYTNSLDIKIRFESGNVKRIFYQDFKNGRVKDELSPSVLGIGYFGLGEYSEKYHFKLYQAWKHMLKRCYDAKFHEKESTYKNCIICKDWLNFQNFAKWYEENYYEVSGSKMELDKDILLKGNKIYSPETCVFVPVNINLLFIKCDKSRGRFPIGVDKEGNKYKARISTIKKRVYLGMYSTPEEAFISYKVAKEKYIKEVADEYKYKIPKKLYDAMYKYKVEITD